MLWVVDTVRLGLDSILGGTRCTAGLLGSVRGGSLGLLRFGTSNLRLQSERSTCQEQIARTHLFLLFLLLRLLCPLLLLFLLLLRGKAVLRTTGLALFLGLPCSLLLLLDALDTGVQAEG